MPVELTNVTLSIFFNADHNVNENSLLDIS